MFKQERIYAESTDLADLLSQKRVLDALTSTFSDLGDRLHAEMDLYTTEIEELELRAEKLSVSQLDPKTPSWAKGSMAEIDDVEQQLIASHRRLLELDRDAEKLRRGVSQQQEKLRDVDLKISEFELADLLAEREALRRAAEDVVDTVSLRDLRDMADDEYRDALKEMRFWAPRCDKIPTPDLDPDLDLDPDFGRDLDLTSDPDPKLMWKQAFTKRQRSKHVVNELDKTIRKHEAEEYRLDAMIEDVTCRLMEMSDLDAAL